MQFHFLLIKKMTIKNVVNNEMQRNWDTRVFLQNDAATEEKSLAVSQKSKLGNYCMTSKSTSRDISVVLEVENQTFVHSFSLVTIHRYL